MIRVFLLFLAGFALAACEFERKGRQALPMAFLGVETELTALDIVEITVAVARPRPGALEAYADCAGAQYAVIRGLEFARPIARFPERSGFADVVVEKTSFLLTDLPPTTTAKRAPEIVADCKARNIPTV